MGRRKYEYLPKSWETPDPKNKKYVAIHALMLRHPSWIDLTPKQQVLYMNMKMQVYSKDRPKSSVANGEPPAEAFYFNEAMWLGKLYTNKPQYYRDRDMLIERGFIAIFENGRNTKTKNIYVPSNKWHKS